MDTYDKQMDETDADQSEDFSSIVLQHDPKKPKNTSRYKMQLPYTIREEGGKTPFLQGLSMQFPPMEVYLNETIWTEWHKQATESMKSIVMKCWTKSEFNIRAKFQIRFRLFHQTNFTLICCGTCMADEISTKIYNAIKEIQGSNDLRFLSNDSSKIR